MRPTAPWRATLATLITLAGLAAFTARAEDEAAGKKLPPPAGIRRTDLQRSDLSVPGREVIQVRVDFDPGAFAPPHAHPGEEVVYVLEGSLEYQVAGQPATRLEAGQVLFVPAGAIHSARNVGRGQGSELATYIVEKGRPLLVPAPR